MRYSINKIDRLNSSYFEKFLKFAKTKENGTFVVMPRAGMEIYDRDNNKKIADIWAKGIKMVDIFLKAKTGFGSSKKILKKEKLERAMEIYNRLKEEYKIYQETF